jgi:hypothetical protein
MRIYKKSQVHQLVMGIVTIAVVLGVGLVVMQQLVSVMNVTTSTATNYQQVVSNIPTPQESDPSFQTQSQPDSSIGSDSEYSKQITQQYLDWKDGAKSSQPVIEPPQQQTPQQTTPFIFNTGIVWFALLALIIPAFFIIWFFWMHRF